MLSPGAKASNANRLIKEMAKMQISLGSQCKKLAEIFILQKF
jgi:hypothetical protein